MDLGLKDRAALVCAGSRGLGKACAMSLAREGCNILLNARDAEVLEQAAAEITKEAGVKVKTIAADLNTDRGRAEILAACPEPDILVNNNAGPPPGKLADWTRDLWMQAIEANMLAPIS